MPGLDPRKSSSLSAYLGLVTMVLDEARKAPRRVVTLQVHALTTVLGAGGRALQEYGHLGERGEQLVARLRGGGGSTAPAGAAATSANGAAPSVNGSAFDTAGEAAVDTVDEAPFTTVDDASFATAADAPLDTATDATFDTVGDAALDADVEAPERGPLDGVGMSGAAEGLAGLTTDDVEVMAEVVAETIVAELQDDVLVDDGTGAALAAGDPLADAGYSVDDVLDAPPAPGLAPAVDGRPTAGADEPAGDVDGAAPVVALPVTPEPVPEAAAQPGAMLSHDELPLADYDHMTLGGLRGRLRVLDLTSLQQLLDYERAHADRLSIVTMLSNRIAKVQAQGAPAGPSERVSLPASAPDAPRSSQTGSRVGPATRGPKQNPPSQGVPSNPAQPR